MKNGRSFIVRGVGVCLAVCVLGAYAALPSSTEAEGAAAKRGHPRTTARPSPTTPEPEANDGFTVLRPGPHSRVIYVSASLGDDANDGLSEAHPVRSIARGIGLARDHHPDFVLFRKGDTWESGLGQWKLSGRSASEPMVVSSYGTGERPKFLSGAEQDAIITFGAGGAPASNDFVAFVGLHFESPTREWGHPQWRGMSEATGLRWLRGTRGLLVEDCVFQAFGVGVVFQAETTQSNIVFRRNLVLDTWDRSHAQSLYIDNVSSIVIEGNIIVHKGFDTHAEGSGPTIFSQAIYVQTNARGVVVRDNIVLNGTSHGLQLRPGGVAEGNLFAHNAIGLLAGGGNEPVPGGVTAIVKDNVILEGTDISDAESRGWGIDLSNVKTATVSGNVIAHAVGRAPGTPIVMVPRARYVDNTVYDWGSHPNSPSGPFADPNRTLASYNASRGGRGTYEDFVAELRKQSRDHYRADYTARAVNDYIRAGFRER